MKIARLITVLCLVFVATLLHGCAAGSATAGYALKASTADDIGSEGRQRIIKESLDHFHLDQDRGRKDIVEQAVAESKAYTDARILELEQRIKKSVSTLETSTPQS